MTHNFLNKLHLPSDLASPGPDKHYLLITMIAVIRPVLMSFLGSDKVKRLIVDLLRKLAEKSDNTVDDAAVDVLERGLFGDK